VAIALRRSIVGLCSGSASRDPERKLDIKHASQINSTQHTKDLIKKVRKIELKTRGLSNHIFSGEYHSAFKGRGMAFSEVREYVPGDEVRAIDWNVTARLGHPFIKVFRRGA
jgi:hypothetical protein